ncbi:spore germination protein KC [Paenibacillus sp. 1_12]|uniref:Ger(x)C family spore germination protein n=1 Tax=Paenibacillus sp. 1_12 TaxID=1566278 RepID=UPI0008E6EB67|nr:Ger(x)C family spore germination protein [Paenibacillus sp. 1_12]SFK82495.1 spore germination protein KC [Paenibacillus sp. 1_12]
MRRLPACLIIGLLIPLLAGCWDRNELNQISIVVGLGIDKIDGMYKVSVQIVNPTRVAAKGGVSSSSSPVVTFEESGKTVPEALRRMEVKAPRKLYFAHLRMIVLGEELAKSGISKPLDFISRSPQMRTDFYLIIAKNSYASEVLKIFSRMDPIPANNLYTTLEVSDKLWAATGKITLDKLIQELSAKGKNPALTGVEIVGNKKIGESTMNTEIISPPTLLKYSGMAIFKLDRMVGWIGEEETKALNYVQNTVNQTVGYLSCPNQDGNITVDVVNVRSYMDTRIKNGKPIVDIKVRVEQNISDIECDIDITQQPVLNKLKEESDQKLEKMIESSIHKVQKQYATDIFGFGELIHQKNPKIWSQFKDWNEEFKQLEVDAHVDTIFRRMGTIVQSVDHQTEE